MDSPHFGEHGAESQSKSETQKPSSQLANDGEMDDWHRIAIHPEENDAAQQQDDANEHNIITRRLR